MSTEPPHRSKTGGTTGEQDTNTGGGPYRGAAGTIHRAHEAAPDGVSRQLVEDVAFQAMREERHPVEIWDERDTGAEPTTLTEFISNPGGGE